MMLLSRFSLGFKNRERAVQPPRISVALIAYALLAQPLCASEVIKPTLDVQDLRVMVSYVSTGELVKLQGKYGANIDRREIRQDYRHGFSILKTNRETGARTCEIYLPNEQRPDKVDDDGTLTLGHELLHCMLGNYHR
jgi:hypothetical protein